MGEPAGDGETDPSIELSSTAGGEAGDGTSRERTPTSDGSSIQVGVGFRSAAAVDAVCIGFGSPDNTWCIPASGDGVNRSGSDTEGALVLQIQFPPELCAMLSSICHDIRCYESARTANGTFSRANINMLAHACGSCDEPSCQDLLSECEAPPPPAGDADHFAICNSVCRAARSCDGTMSERGETYRVRADCEANCSAYIDELSGEGLEAEAIAYIGCERRAVENGCDIAAIAACEPPG